VKFYVDAPFTYRSTQGDIRYVTLADTMFGTYGRVFDTSLAVLAVSGSWVPPLTGLRPMDAAAKTALDAARAGKEGQYFPGCGLVPVNEPVWVP
jgi:hypothetical protein